MAKSSSEKKSTVILTHVIPTLGKIQVELFGPAERIYRVFENRELKRLRNLLQLGKLSRIHSGAHHTRWDYIMLKLYLLKIFKLCPGTGLASNVPSLGLSSGCEALQSYSLLRNFGHLDGCFETERLLLEACVNNTHARTMLLRLVPARFKTWARKLIDNERIFQFYQLLAVIFVKHSIEFQDELELKKQSLDLLHEFLVKDNNRIQILRARHREIRTLAYLALDMHYAPVGIEFNLGSILVAAKEYGPKIFGSSISGFKYLSSNIRDYVTETVYTSPDAIWAFTEFKRRAYRRILDRLKRPKSEETYFNYLESLKFDSPEYIPRKRPVYAKLNLRQHSWSPQPEKPITKAIQLETKFQINQLSDMGVVSLPNGRISCSYVYFHSGVISQEGGIAHRYKILLSEISNMVENNVRNNRKNGRPAYLLRPSIRDSLDSLFRSILYLITNDQYEILLERTGVPGRISGVCCKSRPKTERRIREILKSRFLSRLSRTRRAELECLLPAVNATSGGVIGACFSNIKILRKEELHKDGKEYEAAEIDGAVLVSNSWHTKLLLIESKKQRSSSAATARKQLESLFLKKIEIVEKFKPCFEKIVEIPNKGAFLPIRLP